MRAKVSTEVKKLRPFCRSARISALVFILPALTAADLQAGEIHDAVAAGDLKMVRALLAADPRLLESKDDGGNTPLHSACTSRPPSFTRPVAVASFLLDEGANANARNNYGFRRKRST